MRAFWQCFVGGERDLVAEIGLALVAEEKRKDVDHCRRLDSRCAGLQAIVTDSDHRSLCRQELGPAKCLSM